MSQEKKDIKLTIRMSEDLRDFFLTHCKLNGFSLSKRIRILIEKDAEGKLTIEK